MPEAPHITVVVPAYNQGPYVGRTLESLLNQRVAPFEIIVSNNHSTDETTAVLAGYADRVRIVSPPTFLPAGDHADFVISQVQTPWCALLSSDDLAEPNYIEVFAESIAKYPAASLVHAGLLYIDKDEHTAVPRFALKSKEYAPFPENLIEQLPGPVVNFASFAFRVDAYQKTRLFAPWIGMGDWPIFLELSQFGPFIYQKKVIARYRCNYRPNINRDRYVQFLHDECLIATDLIPSILKNQGVLHLESLHIRKSRERYFGRLAELYDYGNEIDRRSALAHLGKWAEYLGENRPEDVPSRPISLRLWRVKEIVRYEVKRFARAAYGRIKYYFSSHS